MKRFVLVMLILSMLLTASPAFADDMGIQIIGGPEIETEAVNLDDFKLHDLIEIDGYGEVELVEVRWGRGRLVLFFDILNTQLVPHSFQEDFGNVVCTYDEVYQFGGWIKMGFVDGWGDREYHTDSRTAGDTGSMYRELVVVGVTLPEDVIKRVDERGKPLTLTFTMDNNEVTYIRRSN